MALLSPTDCYYCRSNTNIQNFRLPCGCTIQSHPDCYLESVVESRQRIDSVWKIRCPKCNIIFNAPDTTLIKVVIEDDDEMRPFTRREMRKERCKICTILSVQGIVIIAGISFVLWGYVKIIMGSI